MIKEWNKYLLWYMMHFTWITTVPQLWSEQANKQIFQRLEYLFIKEKPVSEKGTSDVKYITWRRIVKQIIFLLCSNSKQLCKNCESINAMFIY